MSEVTSLPAEGRSFRARRPAVASLARPDDLVPPDGFDEPSRSTPRTAIRPRPSLHTSDISRWIGVDPPAIRFVIEDLVPRGMVTLLAGDGGAGKTLLTQLMLTCSSAAEPFLGLEVEQGAVAGVFGEDPDGVLHGRQLRICRELGVSLEDLRPHLHVESYLGTDLALWRNQAPTDFFAELEADLRRIPSLSLVVIDSSSLVFASNENDRGLVAQFMSLLNGLASRLNAAIVLLSHTSKSQTDEAVGMASGSTAWVWQARSALLLRANKEGGLELKHVNANHSKKRNPIALQWSDQGVLVRDLEAATVSTKRQMLTGDARLALDSLTLVMADRGEPAPGALQLPAGTRVVRYDTWRPKLAAALSEPGEDLTGDRLRQACSRTFRTLVAKGAVARHDPYVWIIREPSA